jgi:SOS-response transcriptional repressor LexA
VEQSVPQINHFALKRGQSVPDISEYRRYFLSCQEEMSKILNNSEKKMDWKRIVDILERHCSTRGRPLYKILEVRPQFLSDLRSGKSKNPNAEFLARIIIKFNINPEWLENETAPMFRENEAEAASFPKSRLDQELEQIISSQVSPHFTAIEERLARLEERLDDRKAPSDGNYTGEPEPEYEAEEQVKIPYVENIAAGPPIAQSEDLTGHISVPARYIKKGRQYYAATIRGASMSETGIRDGDAVLIRCTDTPANGAIQVLRYHGKSTLKRLREVEGGGWEMHYEDGSGKVVPLDSGDYEVQGDFVAVLPGIGVPGGRKKGRQTHETPLENR